MCHCRYMDCREGTDTGGVVEFPEKLCSHWMLEEIGWRSEIDSPPGNPLQPLHRQKITEARIQFIPIIQQRPLVTSRICPFLIRESRSNWLFCGLRFGMIRYAFMWWFLLFWLRPTRLYGVGRINRHPAFNYK